MTAATTLTVTPLDALATIGFVIGGISIAAVIAMVIIDRSPRLQRRLERITGIRYVDGTRVGGPRGDCPATSFVDLAELHGLVDEARKSEAVTR